MRLRRLIKKNAAMALRRHWCRAAAISLITLIFWAVTATLEQLVMLLFDIASYVDISSPELMLDNLPNTAPAAIAVLLFVGLLSFLVIVPLMLGVTRWFYNITDGRALATIEIFEYFFSAGGYFKTLWFSTVLFFRKLFWTVVFLMPPVAMICAGNFWRQQASRDIELLLSLGLELFGGVLFILLGWFWLTWMQRYVMAPYILISDDGISVRNAVKRSVMLSRGRLTELLILELSLIGWRIAEILIVPRLFTLPYINTVYSLYTRYLTELYARAEAKAEEERRSSSEQCGEEQAARPTEEGGEEISDTDDSEDIAQQ